jgi:uncharacterized RDD family membrane protein YckC
VDLQLEIGTSGERAVAFIIDLIINLVALGLITLVCAFAAISMENRAFGELAFVVWVLGSFLLRNFYFTLFEMGPRAATPGKRFMGLRVAARDGGRLRAEAVFGRNAMRELEVYLPLSFLAVSFSRIGGWIALFGWIWCAVFLLFPLFNRDRLRVGDLIAGTWVVKAPKRKLRLDLAGRGGGAEDYAFTTAQLDTYGVKELHVLEDVLRDGDRAVRRAVADRIRGRIGWTEPDGGDLEFLTAYYAALRGRLETRLLFGKRKADKFDKS